MVKVKNFFIKAGLWFKNHAPTKRRLIQVYAALLTNANIKGFIDGRIYTGNVGAGGTGGTKNTCVPGLNCYSCPGAVGACPIGALQDSLANSNTTAPLYILGILGLFGLILARTICGFLCPVGLGQELLYKVKTPKLKKSRYTRLLSYLKYLLLAVLVIAVPLIYSAIADYSVPAFCKYICPAGTFGGAGGLLSHPNNSNLFPQLGYLFTWKFVLLVIFIVASIFIYRFFCRFFCPLGAIYGFFNKIALLGVKLDKKKCVDCGMCLVTCKMDIKHVGDHECINCGECIPVCPTKAISWKGSKLVLAGLSIGLDEEEDATPIQVFANTPAQAQTAAGNGSVITVLPEQQVQPAQSGQTETQAETQASEPTETNPEPQPSEQAVTVEQETQRQTKQVKSFETRLKRRAFWLQFGAWAMALLVLMGALVYYNFIYKQQNGQEEYKVGDMCPDYTFSTVYDTSGARDEDGNLLESISIAECKGTVTVLNFWYTLCAPCIQELPDFEEMKVKYGDDVNVIVLHINDGATDESIQRRIDTLGWSDWGVIFAHDCEEDSYNGLGGRDICPMTVILDKEGEITFSYTGNLSTQYYDKVNKITLLDYQIQSAINK